MKDLPLARALEPDVLVAWAMSSAPLTPEHGFPARVFVPGYFGTNGVKWLSRITLTAERPESLFTTRLYNRPVEGHDVVGYYNRFDVFKLTVDRTRQRPVSFGATDVAPRALPQEGQQETSGPA